MGESEIDATQEGAKNEREDKAPIVDGNLSLSGENKVCIGRCVLGSYQQL
jgi:hypothetical protein